jgi:hypothetical protein
MNKAPTRVQLSRAKGWRMPPNTVKVDRSTIWGNPYQITANLSREESLRLFRLHADEILEVRPDWLEPIRSKNLGCWCRIDQACHADVLLELANRPAR